MVFVPPTCKPLAGVLELEGTVGNPLSIFTTGQIKKQGPKRRKNSLHSRATLVADLGPQGDKNIFPLTTRLPLIVLVGEHSGFREVIAKVDN